jgi:HAD superfamily hydrolase (TIGR01490 family)
MRSQARATRRRRRAAERAIIAGAASARAAVKAAARMRRAAPDGTRPGAAPDDGRGSVAGGVVGPGTPTDLTAAAFFDVDNTMMQGASLYHFARGLAARKFFTSRDIAAFAWRQVKFRVLGSEDMADADGARAAALAFVAGRRVADVVAICEEIYDEVVADKVYAGTRRLTVGHLAAGQRVYLVTAAPMELAQIMARRLGLTGALGTVAEEVDGRYTGRLVGDLLHGPAKAAAVRSLAAREGLNLTRCSAYSDSINDLPMLSTVGTAVAINPDAPLRRWAAGHGWAIHDFRTGRKAAKIGVPSLLGAGMVGGAVAYGAALRRRR